MSLSKRWIAVAGAALGAVLIWLVFFWEQHPPLVVVACDPNIHLGSLGCTFGTNHAFNYGTSWHRFTEPIVNRSRNPTRNRLCCDTDKESTVIWVGFVHPDYGVQPNPLAPGGPMPPPFRAHLTDLKGAKAELPIVNTRMMLPNSKCYLMGWELPGRLNAHRGSVIHIEAPNGNGSVTLRVP